MWFQIFAKHFCFDNLKAIEKFFFAFACNQFRKLLFFFVCAKCNTSNQQVDNGNVLGVLTHLFSVNPSYIIRTLYHKKSDYSKGCAKDKNIQKTGSEKQEPFQFNVLLLNYNNYFGTKKLHIWARNCASKKFHICKHTLSLTLCCIHYISSSMVAHSISPGYGCLSTLPTPLFLLLLPPPSIPGL